MNSHPATLQANVKTSDIEIARLSNDIIRASGDYITYLRAFCKSEWHKSEVRRDFKLMSLPRLLNAVKASAAKSSLYPRVNIAFEERPYSIAFDELSMLIPSSLLFYKMSSMGAVYVAINQFVGGRSKESFNLLENTINAIDVRKDIKTSRTENVDPEKVYGASVLYTIDLKVHELALVLCKDTNELDAAFKKNVRYSCMHYLNYLGTKQSSLSPLTIERAQNYATGQKLFSGEQAYLQTKLEKMVALVNMIDAQEETLVLIDYIQKDVFKAAIAEHKKGFVVGFFESYRLLTTTSTRLLDSLDQDILHYTQHKLLMDDQSYKRKVR